MISAAEYEGAQREIEAIPNTDGTAHFEMGGHALVEFLYVRAIEAARTRRRAREWREVEVAMAECGPEDHQRLSVLQARSLELVAECHAAASDQHDFDAQWPDVA